MTDWLDASAWVIPVVVAITLHEAAHGWMAERFGDDTARLMGRVSFNPLRHIDPFGTIIVPALLKFAGAPFLFGYAKPVPVRFERLNPPRRGVFMVAIAGVLMNLLLGFISALLLHINVIVTPEQAPWLYENLYRSIMINCALIVFNLIPILPLDGGRAVDACLRGRVKRYFGKLERVGIVIVIVVFIAPDFFGVNLIQTLIGTPALWLVKALLLVSGIGH